MGSAIAFTIVATVLSVGGLIVLFHHWEKAWLTAVGVAMIVAAGAVGVAASNALAEAESSVTTVPVNPELAHTIGLSLSDKGFRPPQGTTFDDPSLYTLTLLPGPTSGWTRTADGTVLFRWIGGHYAFACPTSAQAAEVAGGAELHNLVSRGICSGE